MLIALLALLGVNIKRQPGAFRVAEGAIDGLNPKWRRGYGRWVRGDRPVVIHVRAGKASAEVAAHGDDAELLADPYQELVATQASSAGP